MRIGLTIDRTTKLPTGAVSAQETELLTQLQNQFDKCSMVIRRAGSDGLSVNGGGKEVKKVEEILQ